MANKSLVNALFDAGLGELYVLHVTESGPLLGQLVAEKGRLMLKDRGLLGDVETAQIGPCMDVGIVGALCHQTGHEWETLTFVGPDHCKLEQDLSATRVGLMRSAKNTFNERLFDFKGSVHRGFKLLMDNHMLPVVLMKEVSLVDGTPALAVSNLRVAGVPFNVLGSLHSALQGLMEKNLMLEVEDVSLDANDFDALFGKFVGE